MAELHTDQGARQRRAPEPYPASDPESLRLAALYRYGVLDTAAEPAFDALALLAARSCGASSSLISLVDQDRLWFKARVGIDAADAARADSPCSCAIAEPDALMLADLQGDARFAAHPVVGAAAGWRLYAGAPLVTPEGWPVGTLCVLDRDAKALSAQQSETLGLLAQQVIAQLELRRVRTLLDAQCTTDAVTGVWNRQAFERRLQQEWARWERHGGSLALLAIDLDHFKRFNGLYGHARGDEVLQQVALALEGTLRAHDVLAHYGGGEFAVMLPMTDSAGAVTAAERVYRAVDGIDWRAQPMTVSVGVAVATHGIDVEPASMTLRAHRGLTQAKAHGRHRVELYSA